MRSLGLPGRGTRNHWSFFHDWYLFAGFLFQAMDAAQLADDLKAQLELAQKKLHDFQDEIVENRVTREKEMFNFKRAEVYASTTIIIRFGVRLECVTTTFVFGGPALLFSFIRSWVFQVFVH